MKVSIFMLTVVISSVQSADIDFCSGLTIQKQIDTLTRTSYIAIDGSDVAISGSSLDGTLSNSHDNVAKRSLSDVKPDNIKQCTCRLTPMVAITETVTLNVELNTNFTANCPKQVEISPDGVELGCFSRSLLTTLVGGEDMTLTLRTVTSATSPVLYTDAYLLKIARYSAGAVTVEVSCGRQETISTSTTSSVPPATNITQGTNSTHLITVVSTSIDPTFIVVGICLGLGVTVVVLIICVVLIFGRKEMKDSSDHLPQTMKGRMYRRVQTTASRVWKSVKQKRPLPAIPESANGAPGRYHARTLPVPISMYDSIRSETKSDTRGELQSTDLAIPEQKANDVRHEENSDGDVTLRHHDVVVQMTSCPYLHPVSDNVENVESDAGYIHPKDCIRVADDNVDDDSGYIQPIKYLRTSDIDVATTLTQTPCIRTTESSSDIDSGYIQPITHICESDSDVGNVNNDPDVVYANVDKTDAPATGSDVSINIDHDETGYIPMSSVPKKQSI